MSRQRFGPSRIEQGDLGLLRVIAAAAGAGEPVIRAADVPDDAVVPAPAEVLQAIVEILTSAHPEIGIDLLCDAGLAERILPEIESLRTMPATGGRHKDVYRHTRRVVAGTEPDPVLRLAALFHDVGKPPTKRIEDGTVHFPGHAEVGADMTRRRLHYLDGDEHLVDAVTRLVALHLRANSYEPDWTDSAVRRLDRDAGDQLDRLLALSRADVTSARQEAVVRALRRVDALADRIEDVRAADVQPECPLTGHDLMAIFRQPPGPWIGRIKSHLEALVAAGELAAGDTATAERIARDLMAEDAG
ncbi:MAG: HD domain-containing protein [Dehalococcoidia bacterium]